MKRLKKALKRLNFRFLLKSKHLLALMTLFCICCIIATFASGLTVTPFQEATGMVIVPFEKSINQIGQIFTDIKNGFREKEELMAEIDGLKQQIDVLTNENGNLISSQSELIRLQQLYELDQEYTDYPKIVAKIISKDPSNWYSTFMINKGRDDGVRVNNNVIAGKGLVGIVTEVGSNWATVRAIIDDSSNVSATMVSTSDNCIIQGDLELVEEGKLRMTQLYDVDNKVTIGERVVTSAISEKYVEGLFIGYVSEVRPDTNNLTKTGTIVTPVDFSHLQEVFVITVNKSDFVDEDAEVTSLEE